VCSSADIALDRFVNLGIHVVFADVLSHWMLASRAGYWLVFKCVFKLNFLKKASGNE
jgi:hypothetical protein